MASFLTIRRSTDAIAAGNSRVTKSRRSPGTRMRLLPHLCNWISPSRCRNPAEVVFESGLGYCRTHANAVISNREWLRDFVAQGLEKRAAPTAAEQTLDQ